MAVQLFLQLPAADDFLFVVACGRNAYSYPNRVCAEENSCRKKASVAFSAKDMKTPGLLLALI